MDAPCLSTGFAEMPVVALAADGRKMHDAHEDAYSPRRPKEDRWDERTNVVLEDDLVREAFALTGARTQRDLVHLALAEWVRGRRRRDLTELAGKIRLREDFDPKALREVR